MSAPVLNAGEVREILDFLCWHGIPLHYSVNLVAKTMRIDLSKVAKEAGFSKNYLYMCLAGNRTASRELKRAMTKTFGIDVWSVAEEHEVGK